MSRTASELAFLARAMKAPRIAACAESMARRAEEEGWDIDYYMTCLYYLTRPKDDRPEAGEVAERRVAELRCRRVGLAPG